MYCIWSILVALTFHIPTAQLTSKHRYRSYEWFFCLFNAKGSFPHPSWKSKRQRKNKRLKEEEEEGTWMCVHLHPLPLHGPPPLSSHCQAQKKSRVLGEGTKKVSSPFPVVLFLGICPFPPSLPRPKRRKAQKMGGKFPIWAHRKREESQKIMGNQMCRHRSLPLFSSIRICLSVLYVTLILIKEMENWFFCSLWAQKVGFSGNGGCSVRLSSVRNLFRLLLTVKVFWSFGRGGGSKLEANIYLSKNIPSALNSFFC